jgi:uncharacterized membrane protein
MDRWRHPRDLAHNPARREVILRYRDVSRIEGFSDAVFGFALTLLVVQLEVPEDTAGLRDLVRGSVPFAVTFAMICYIWWEHNKFFRRYGLQDAWTAFLNCLLLFVVVFYVYPLKYLATVLLGPGAFPAAWDGRYVMKIYSFGLLAIFTVFVMLYRHAFARRGPLALDATELVTLRFNQRAHVISLALAAVSLVLAFSLPENWVAISGILYGLMGPLHAWNGIRMHRALEKLEPPKPAPAESNA